jgi:hypothetical protein
MRQSPAIVQVDALSIGAAPLRNRAAAAWLASRPMLPRRCAPGPVGPTHEAEDSVMLSRTLRICTQLVEVAIFFAAAILLVIGCLAMR